MVVNHGTVKGCDTYVTHDLQTLSHGSFVKMLNNTLMIAWGKSVPLLFYGRKQDI